MFVLILGPIPHTLNILSVDIVDIHAIWKKNVQGLVEILYNILYTIKDCFNIV